MPNCLYIFLFKALIKEKTIVKIIEFHKYCITVLEKTLNDPNSGIDILVKNRMIVVLSTANDQIIMENKRFTDSINKLTNKEEIYLLINEYINLIRTNITTKFAPNIPDKNIRIDINKKADDLLKILKF